MHASMTGLNAYTNFGKSSQSIISYEKYKFSARAPQAIYAPFFAIYLISIDIDQIIVISTFIFSIIVINIFLIAWEIYFIKGNSITFNQITKNFKTKEKAIYSVAGLFDIFMILVPISLNLLGIYLIPKYSQAVVQLLGIFQGAYTFYLIYFMKARLSFLMDNAYFTKVNTAQILVCKIVARILIIFFSIFSIFLYLL